MDIDKNDDALMSESLSLSSLKSLLNWHLLFCIYNMDLTQETVMFQTVQHIKYVIIDKRLIFI